MFLSFWQRWPLAVRLTLLITTIVMLAVLLVTSLSVRRERRTFHDELEQRAVLLLDTIVASSGDSLYFLDADYLSDLMRDLGRNQVVSAGRIYDAEGRVVADALNDDARFSLEPDPFGEQLLAVESTVFVWEEEQLVAGRPVRLGAETVGAVSIGLPTAPLAEKVQAVRGQGVSVAAFGVLVGLALALMASRSITDPLREMIEATELVGEGDLTQRVAIRSSVELATLGRRFNEMTGRLAETMQEREQQIAELDAFSHTVAHDLKTPLNFITGISELVSTRFDEIPPGQLRQYMRNLNHSGRRAASIIDELLLLATVRQQDVVLGPLDMGPVVEAALNRLTFQIEEHEAEIELPEEWPVALGYAPWVGEIWVNYLSNGLKYGGRPPRLVLGWERSDGGMIRFWVRDNGQGLSAEQQAVVFTEFVRLSEIQVEGYGLGLSIVRRIVEKLSGEVGVTSSEGKGSEFFFTLPAGDDAGGSTEEPARQGE